MIAIASVVVFMWMLTQFIIVLHGFVSPLKVFVGIIFTLFGMSMLFAIVASMLGFVPGEV